MRGNTANRRRRTALVPVVVALVLPALARASEAPDGGPGVTPPQAKHKQDGRSGSRRCEAVGKRARGRAYLASSSHHGGSPGDSHFVAYVFKGLVADANPGAQTVTVAVSGGNCRARRFTGQDVTFTLDHARLRVRDVNHDGDRDMEDIRAGDRVLVKARMPLVFGGPAQELLSARKFVDKGPPGRQRR